MELPQSLRAALDQVTTARTVELASHSQELSRRYRERTPKGGRFVQGAPDVAAYAATRLPATYAACRAAMNHVAARLPDFAPASLLDTGCGPGTALWAAATQWPGIGSFAALERDGDMLALARALAGHAPLDALRRATLTQADLCGQWDAPAHDLVTACYVLGELPPEQAGELVRRLWQRTAGALLLVEPGTKGGFATVLRARDVLIKQGEALIAAPCPHGDACPMAGGDWCHFSQRVARSRAHRQLKGAELGYEDEKYSYICATRLPVRPMEGRVLRHPLVRKGHVVLSLCTAQGIKETTLSKRTGAAYQHAKDLHWGDAME